MVNPALVAYGVGAVLAVVALLGLWVARRRDGDGGTPDSTASIPTLGRRTGGRQSLRRRLTGLVTGVFASVLGSERQLPMRVILLFGLANLALVVWGATTTLLSGAQVKASSGPFLRGLLELVTNFYIYTGALFLTVVLGYLFVWDIIARVTAKHTPFSRATVKRLSDEVKARDGATRLVGTSDHSANELMVKLEYALRNQDDLVAERPGNIDDQYPIGDDSDDAGGDDAAALTSKEMPRLEPPGGAGGAERREAGAQAGETPSDEWLDGDVDPAAAAAPAGYDDVWDAWRDGQEAGRTLAFHLAATGEYAAEPTPVDELGLVQQHERLLDEEFAAALEAGAEANPDADADDGGETDESAAEAGSPDLLDESDEDPAPGAGESMSVREQLALFRMDFATAGSFDDILTRFVLPAVIAMGVVFTVLRTLWLTLPMYGVVLGIGGFVGSIVYFGAMVRRRRRLRKHRQDRDRGSWGSATALVKTVETPEVTAYIMFVAGKTYLDYDRDRLVRKGARRWYQAINNEAIWPSVQEKFARNVRHMIPTINEFLVNNEHEGLIGIYHDFADVVREASDPEGVVPKRQLARKVVERGHGPGHDPELVARAYRHLYRWVLQEQDVVIHDADGDPHEMTLVHLRSAPVRDDVAEVMATHSQEYEPHKPARYPLPDVGSPSMLDDDLATRVDVDATTADTWVAPAASGSGDATTPTAD